ncbi:MAG: hypothetical protein RL026_1621 [Pseudomonadota bacterium]|jgi:hypothetical protein
MSAVLTLQDRLDIHDLVSRYAWCLDTADADGFVACFGAEGELVWDVFETPGSWRGAAALRRFVDYFKGRPESALRQHHVSNLTVTLDGGKVRARSYVLVALRDGAGPHRVNVMGHYDDELSCETGHWQFRRRVIRDWSGPVVANFAGQDGARSVRPRPQALDGLWATQS